MTRAAGMERCPLMQRVATGTPIPACGPKQYSPLEQRDRFPEQAKDVLEFFLSSGNGYRETTKTVEIKKDVPFAKLMNLLIREYGFNDA
jgi:hypothetical protein